MQFIMRLGGGILLIFCFSATVFARESVEFTPEANHAYQLATDKIRNIHDNDPYALQRFEYIIDKIHDRLNNCHDDFCIVDADRDALDVSNAIVKADADKPYWRELKLCETSQCAEKLIGSLDSAEVEANVQKDQNSPPISSGSSPQQAIAHDPVTASSPNNQIPSSPPTYDDLTTISLTIFAILAGLIILTFVGLYARRKCPKCGRRGTLIRTNRQILDQRQGTRIRTVEEVAEHRSRNDVGMTHVTGTSVTKRKIPISTLSFTYLDTCKCRRCNNEFNSTSLETRDI